MPHWARLVQPLARRAGPATITRALAPTAAARAVDVQLAATATLKDRLSVPATFAPLEATTPQTDRSTQRLAFCVVSAHITPIAVVKVFLPASPALLEPSTRKQALRPAGRASVDRIAARSGPAATERVCRVVQAHTIQRQARQV